MFEYKNYKIIFPDGDETIFKFIEDKEKLQFIKDNPNRDDGPRFMVSTQLSETVRLSELCYRFQPEVDMIPDLNGQDEKMLGLLENCYKDLEKYDLSSKESFNIFISKKSNQNRNFIGIRISAKYFFGPDVYDKFMEYEEEGGDWKYKDYIFFNTNKIEQGIYLDVVGSIATSTYRSMVRHYKHLPNTNAKELMLYISRFILEKYGDILDDLDINWYILENRKFDDTVTEELE